ncbi:MbtH family NRPS accessory protein [Streptomyces parvus]
MEEAQYLDGPLWPAGTDVSHGWAPAHGPSGPASCLAYVDAHWRETAKRA